MGLRHSHIPNGNGDSAGHNHFPPPQPPPVNSQPDGDPTQVDTQPPPEQSTSSTSDPTPASSTTHTIPQDQSSTPSPTNQQSNVQNPSPTTILQATTIIESKDGNTSVIVSTITVKSEDSLVTQPMLAATASTNDDNSTGSDSKTTTQGSVRPTNESDNHSSRTVTSFTPTITTQSSMSSALPSSESEKSNGFLSNKPAAITTFVLSSLLFLVLLGICTGLIYKYRRRRRQTQLEAQPTAFRFDPDSDGITQTRSGVLQPNRRGEIIQPGYTKEVDQCHLAGGPTASGMYIPPPEYQENGYGYGYGFGTGKNHDEKLREDTRLGHDVDDEDTQPAELMSPTSDGAFSDMITSNDDQNRRRISHEIYTSAQNSRSSLIST